MRKLNAANEIAAAIRSFRKKTARAQRTSAERKRICNMV
jgi:hypothetical protein